MGNEQGFTLIELIIVIVILGILAVAAMPKYMDMQTEAAEAAANGVYGAAQAACAINFAASLVGKTAANRPAYDASTCTAGTIITTGVDGGTCLMNAIDGTPDGWSVDADTITATVNSVAYVITISSEETSTAKAQVTKSW